MYCKLYIQEWNQIVLCRKPSSHPFYAKTITNIPVVFCIRFNIQHRTFYHYTVIIGRPDSFRCIPLSVCLTHFYTKQSSCCTCFHIIIIFTVYTASFGSGPVSPKMTCDASC